MNRSMWAAAERKTLASTSKKFSLVTHVRGSLLTSSMRALRERGRFERYLAALANEAHKESLLSMIASMWVPIDVAMTHYEACETLGIPEDELLRIGEQVSERMQGSYLGTLLRLGKNGGLTTPEMAYAQYDRFWDRMMVGGSIHVVQVGPKDVQIEARGLRLAAIPYFRIGFRGVNRAGIELFCRKAYVSELPQLCGATSLGYQISWV